MSQDVEVRVLSTAPIPPDFGPSSSSVRRNEADQARFSAEVELFRGIRCRCSRTILTPAKSDIPFDHESGVLDAARLARAQDTPAFMNDFRRRATVGGWRRAILACDVKSAPVT